jgi:hypothetical protein
MRDCKNQSLSITRLQGNCRSGIVYAVSNRQVGFHRGPPVLSHRSPSMLAGVQNPCSVSERDIDALLPKRRAKLGRKLVQHRLDGRIGEMTEVGVDRFARE